VLEEERRGVEACDASAPLRQAVGDPAVTAGQVKDLHTGL
jgi:hypothetical protein